MGGSKIRIVLAHVDYIRIIFVHLDYVRNRIERKMKTTETVKLEKDSMEGGVVLFCSAEKIDENNPNNVIENATAEIIRHLEMIKTKKVMIYPYVNYTTDLSSPQIALDILNGLESSLEERDLDVKKAAFGWYKELEMKVKQHPLSNISITALPESKQKSKFFYPVYSNRIEKKNYVYSIQ